MYAYVGHDGLLPLRRTVKDSVFANLFSHKEYTLGLYKGLHPEDALACVDDIEIVTIQNIMTANQHNDLGFIVGDRLLVLVEAQSTWSPNIVLRALLYASHTLKDYIHDHGLSIYGSAPVRVPRPELYVVYTGDKDDVPDELTLSEALFGGESTALESRVTVLKQPGSTMAGQYIDFAKTVDRYRVARGPNEEAVRGAIQDCVARGVLVEYLKEHEKEVVGIMVTLYDEEEIMRIHLASVEREAKAAGMAEGRAEGRAEGVAEGRAEGRAEGVVAMCKEFGLSLPETVDKLVEKLGVSKADAEAMAEPLW